MSLITIYRDYITKDSYAAKFIEKIFPTEKDYTLRAEIYKRSGHKWA